MANHSSRGRFVWYDLMTSDPKGAEAFYPKAAGWGTQPWGEMAYTMWTANGQPIGGVMQLPKEAGAPPHWLAYISVPDVDGAGSLAESLGGKVLKPAADIPNVGRFAILEDPHGARFAVFTSADQTPRPDTEPAVGDFSWHELATRDYSQAFAFYEALFGWERSAEHDMGPLGVYFIFKHDGRDLGGMFNITPEMPMPPNWLHYIRVDSADGAAERVDSADGAAERVYGQRRSSAQRPDGRSRRRSGRAVSRSAGRLVRGALEGELIRPVSCIQPSVSKTRRRDTVPSRDCARGPTHCRSGRAKPGRTDAALIARTIHHSAHRSGPVVRRSQRENAGAATQRLDRP